VSEGISLQELQLAARNHGMPLEALCWDVTPIGLHYLLTHFDIPAVDASSWLLRVEGLVERPLALSLDELRKRTADEIVMTMECAGNGRAHIEPHVFSQPWLVEAVGTARWRGVRVAALLEEAGVRDAATEAIFRGLDRGIDGGEEQEYERSLPVAALLEGDALLAYEMNGAPLPPQHGFPLRLVVPGWYGMTSVKWLSHVIVRAEPFEGYQMRQAYRVRYEEGEPGEPITMMAPRALMIPPGIPEFRSRVRLVEAGPCEIVGRAWSGAAEILGVDVSTDGGRIWSAAELGDAALGRWAWRTWRFTWVAEPGEHELCCRARDAAGNEQPLEPPWNVGGYLNNAVQRVSATVPG
jgi:DMSO/TMAO reductase YedYZ molybdopterin-dependent catalytic subunit